MTLINQYGKDTYYNFEVISGINIGILFPLEGYTRDIIFPEKGTYKVRIIYSLSKEVKEFDVKDGRLLLINFNYIYPIYINDIFIKREIMYSCPHGDSSQICVFDLTKKILFSKAISTSQFDLFIKSYERYKDEAQHFFDSFAESINNNNLNNFNFDEY